MQSHPVRVCKVPQRPGLHLAAPSEDPLQPVALLAVQPLHVDLWQTGCTPANPIRQVHFHTPPLHVFFYFYAGFNLMSSNT